MKARIEISEISKSDFKNLELPILFENNITDRVFGVISNGINEYKFGWQSTLIKPVIKFINDNYCSIGIDLDFIIFDFVTGSIMQKLNLDYFFFNTKIFNEYIYVITQLEIIKISATNFIVVETIALPDYFESIQFGNKSIRVKCFNDNLVFLKSF